MLMSCWTEVRALHPFLDTDAQDDPKRITNVVQTQALVPLSGEHWRCHEPVSSHPTVSCGFLALDPSPLQVARGGYWSPPEATHQPVRSDPGETENNGKC